MKTLEKINQEWKSYLKKERIRFLVKNKLAYVEHLEQMNVIDVNWRKSAYSFEKNLHIIAFQYKQYEFHYRKHDIGGEFSYGNNTLTECLSEDCITLFKRTSSFQLKKRQRRFLFFPCFSLLFFCFH